MVARPQTDRGVHRHAGAVANRQGPRAPLIQAAARSDPPMLEVENLSGDLEVSKR
jgi:hypothetical protein